MLHVTSSTSTSPSTPPHGRMLGVSRAFLFLNPFNTQPSSRTLLRSTLPPVIQPRGGNVGMPQPFLHLGNVRVVRTRTRPV